MISAEVGLSVNVTGNSIAIVATGPMPGSTPIERAQQHPHAGSKAGSVRKARR